MWVALLLKNGNASTRKHNIPRGAALPDARTTARTAVFTVMSIRRFFFLFEFMSPRTYDPGFRFLVNKAQNRRKTKQKRSKFFFSCKNGLKQW